MDKGLPPLPSRHLNRNVWTAGMYLIFDFNNRRSRLRRNIRWLLFVSPHVDETASLDNCASRHVFRRGESAGAYTATIGGTTVCKS